VAVDEPGAVEPFVTTDPERAHAFLRETYVESAMRIRGSQDGFSMRHAHHDVGPFTVASLSHTMEVEHSVEPMGYLLIGQVLGGHLECESAGHAVRLSEGDVLLFASPEAPYTVRWDPISLRLVRIDLAALTQLGFAADGRAPRFTDLRPVTPGNARHLTETVNWVAHDLLANPQLIGQPLITGTAARMLAATVLHTFPHTAPAEATPRDSASAMPAVLRRAIEFIDCHAETDISPADIAAATRVTPRTVQHAFRRHLDTTVTGYLRRVRLDRAHHDLRAADPTRGDTVTAIAARWGFANPGRFATSYRAIYGCRPHEDLHS
jgi:AraC-like DNA-binding protein